ncbi:MAG: rhomboid family intramembrane serine protease [Vicinamibacterales bacterium]
MIPLRDVIPARTRPVVTIALLLVNAAVFAVEAGLDEQEIERFVRVWGLVPAAFSWTAVATSMFVHGGFLHFAGNMLYLWIFGDNVEDRLGRGRFLVFYLLCGAGAAVAQTLVAPDSPIPMVGASGAIAGVMGAYFVLYPRSRVLTLFPFPLMLFEMPAVYLLGVWFVMQFVNGLGSLSLAREGDLAGGVAFWAHVAGFAVGVILVLILRRPERQRVEWWDRVDQQMR